MHAHEMRSRPQTLEESVSHTLDRQADAIAAAWLGTAEADARPGSPGSAQFARLKAQVPEVVRGLADFIRFPSSRSRATVIDRLRLHTELRRQQGYDVQELLTEYEFLSRLIFDAFIDAVRSFEGKAQPIDVARLAARLRESLMEITSEAVGLYRKRELEQRSELAQRLSTFASAITHELKNPLGAAQAGTEMLRDRSVITSADQQDRFTKLVLRNLVRVHDLIDEIRGLVVAPDAAGEARQAGLDDVVQKVFSELRDEAEAKGVVLETEGALPDGSVDAFRAEIVLVNLVGNAIKYSDPAKATRWVRVSAKPSRLDAATAAWAITVRDNGLGIPEALQGDVFRRHFRGHPNAAEGTGLGLTIAEEVTKAGGGRITFESVERRGTSFRVILPERGDGPRSDAAFDEPLSSRS